MRSIKTTTISTLLYALISCSNYSQPKYCYSKFFFVEERSINLSSDETEFIVDSMRRLTPIEYSVLIGICESAHYDFKVEADSTIYISSKTIDGLSMMHSLGVFVISIANREIGIPHPARIQVGASVSGERE